MKTNKNNEHMIGADIGGSHISVAIIDASNKRIRDNSFHRRSVNSKAKAEEILDEWIKAISYTALQFGDNVYKLALAMPGPFDYANGISYITGLDKYDQLYKLDIRSALAKGLQIPACNILFRNDAEAFLHGEASCGAGKEYSHIVGFTLGTGMGSARYLDGVTSDLNWGSVSYGGAVADDYFSTRWFVSYFEQVTGIYCRNVKEIVETADAYHHVSEVFDIFQRNFAEFVIEMIRGNVPQSIILGGNICKAHKLFFSKLTETIQKFSPDIIIKMGELNEYAPMIGAVQSFKTGQCVDDETAIRSKNYITDI